MFSIQVTTSPNCTVNVADDAGLRPHEPLRLRRCRAASVTSAGTARQGARRCNGKMRKHVRHGPRYIGSRLTLSGARR